MAETVLAYKPSEKSQEAFLEYFRQCNSLLNQQYKIRDQLLQIDKSYMREMDQTEEQAKARLANKRGNPNKFQNVTIPVIMPKVESALSYQQSVFLQGYPIFGVVSYPEFADAALMMDTIIGEQQIRYRWTQEITKAIRNGLKYNLGAIECDWHRETTYSISNSTESTDGKQQDIIFAGNKLKSLDMYNTFWDTRVAPSDLPEHGEFVGYTELYSRIRLKQFINNLPTKINVKEAFECGSTAPIAFGSEGVGSFYLPHLNPEALIDLSTAATTNWYAWAGLAAEGSNIQYRDMYQVTTLYGRILPSDFGLKGVPGPNTPQVWKIIIVNNQVIIHAERMTNAHNLIPVFFCTPLEDGLSYQTKSFAKNLEPFQEITTALANSSIASRRRAISDRMLFDPTRVSPAAINNDSPSAKIPVRPSAYQDDLSKAVYPIPFRDDQFQVNSAEVQFYSQLANEVSGLNPARQGQFVKGNKTRFEFSEIMSYANGRDQSMAIGLETSFFTPMKEVIKLNILQYQSGVVLYNREQQTEVNVDPVTLRQANLVFRVSDGLLPSEKLIDGESMAMAMQTIASSQQLAAGYNLAPMFSYLMKMRGARLTPFEKSQEQLAYEQALATWQQGAMQIAAAIEKSGDQLSPEDIQKMLANNPMPKPEDFGYTPGKPTPSPENPLTGRESPILTVGKQVQAMQQQAQSAQTPAQGPE